jgi:hypothetical protein
LSRVLHLHDGVFVFLFLSSLFFLGCVHPSCVLDIGLVHGCNWIIVMLIYSIYRKNNRQACEA